MYYKSMGCWAGESWGQMIVLQKYFCNTAGYVETASRQRFGAEAHSGRTASRATRGEERPRAPRPLRGLKRPSRNCHNGMINIIYIIICCGLPRHPQQIGGHGTGTIEKGGLNGSHGLESWENGAFDASVAPERSGGDPRQARLVRPGQRLACW